MNALTVTRKVPGAIISLCAGSAKQGEVRDFSYGDLQRLSNRFANVLRGTWHRQRRPGVCFSRPDS